MACDACQVTCWSSGPCAWQLTCRARGQAQAWPGLGVVQHVRNGQYTFTAAALQCTQPLAVAEECRSRLSRLRVCYGPNVSACLAFLPQAWRPPGRNNGAAAH